MICSLILLLFNRAFAFRAAADFAAVTSALRTAVVRGRYIPYCIKHAGLCMQEGSQNTMRSKSVIAYRAWPALGVVQEFPYTFHRVSPRMQLYMKAFFFGRIHSSERMRNVTARCLPFPVIRLLPEFI